MSRRTFETAARAGFILLAASSGVAANIAVVDNVGLWQVNVGDCAAPALALQGMGIPYTVNTVAAGPNPDPLLVDADGAGKYSMLVFCSDRLAYAAARSYPSALTGAQWEMFEQYQIKYGVRRATFGVWPNPSIGVNYSPFGGCCSADTHGSDEQTMSFTSEALQLAPFAGMNPSVQLSTVGLTHYPTTLYDQANTPGFANATPVIRFGPTPKVFDSNTTWVGGVVTAYANGRQDMNFFVNVGSWSIGSLLVQHLWIHWGLRSCYPGFRRLYFTAQIDDIFLESPITVNHSAPAAPSEWDRQNTTSYNYRIDAEDVEIHRAWQKGLTARLPSGSTFVLEMIFNGNGVLLAADEKEAIATKDFPEVPYSFKKPLGSGVDAWPSSPKNFSWAQSLLLKDPLYAAFVNRTNMTSDFFWTQHTFTHMELNNATYSDTAKEISFDKSFAGPGFLGLDGKPYYSPNALVPPAITGLLNGDALRAFKDNGIYYVCGDNTRPELVNSASSFWPLLTTVADNGFDGIVIIPRFATNIYYNVTNFVEEEYLYNTIYFNRPDVRGTWADIYAREVAAVTHNALALRPDAYMFHQANLRAKDILQPALPYFPSGKFSLVMLWAEMITESFKKHVVWPVVSRPMQEMARVFLDRQNRDTCGARVVKLGNGTHLTGVRVTGGTKRCTWPVSVPGSVQSRDNANSGWKFERLSAVDPLTVWVPTVPGQQQTILLDPPIPWTTY